MVIPTLAERLQTEFGGRIEAEWGVPNDEHLHAELTDINKKPNDNLLDLTIIRYFVDYGFSGMQETKLSFEHPRRGHRCACYTYSEKQERLIVTASRF